ncbi:MAG: hypothetical protein JWL81_2954 [Verrucomicrobiales bacterium]|nr:hypothetical protein [Verrucomicrobiales bacterium]
MKKYLLAFSLAAAMLAMPAVAKEFKLPKEDPVFSLKFPDKWEVTYEDESVDGVSPDGAIEIYAQTDDAETIEDSVKESIDYLTGEGVKIQADTETKTDGEHNGMKMGIIGWKGTDKDGACSVSLIFLKVTEDTTMTLIYWATDDQVKKHEKEINAVLDSMKNLTAKADSKDKEEAKDEAKPGKKKGKATKEEKEEKEEKADKEEKEEEEK